MTARGVWPAAYRVREEKGAPILAKECILILRGTPILAMGCNPILWVTPILVEGAVQGYRPGKEHVTRPWGTFPWKGPGSKDWSTPWKGPLGSPRKDLRPENMGSNHRVPSPWKGPGTKDWGTPWKGPGTRGHRVPPEKT